MSILTRTAISAFPFLVTGRLLDRIPEIGDPLACAFSIRRVYTNYTGPGVRVRRSSDGAEKDIGFIQTRLDTDALLEFCNGFDGYVRTWYDQTGQGRHAEQTEWEYQPRLVREGSLVVDTEQNLTIEFNNSYLTTTWEPNDASEMADGTGMMIVGSSGNGIQGQTGTVSNEDTISDVQSAIPPYPEPELPMGQDKYYLESVPLVDGTVRVSLFVDKNKKFSMILPDPTPSVASTGVSAIGGPTVLTATTMKAENIAEVGARANAPETQVAWSHAVEGANGKIYGIPSAAEYVLEIDPTQDPPVSNLIGTQSLGEGSEKWKRGVLVGNYIYASPYNSTDILRIRTDAGQVTVETISTTLNTTGSYFGIATIPNQDVYCIPYNAAAVLHISNTQESLPGNVGVGTISLPYSSSISSKWSDGVYAPSNGKIYGMPWDAGTFLEIDPGEPEASYVGSTGMRISIPGYSNRSSNIQNPAQCGEGYYAAPEITLDPPGSGGTTATVNVSNTTIQLTNVVTEIPILASNGGSGYISPPTLRISEGSKTSQRRIQATITSNDLEEVVDGEGNSMGKRVKSITITDHGRGYISPSGITIEGGKGRDASIRAVIDADSDLQRIYALDIIDPGNGYFDLENVNVTIGAPSAGGQQAVVNNADLEWELVDESDPTLGYRLIGIKKFIAGTKYERVPVVRVTGGHGTFATAETPVLTQDAHVHSPTLTASTGTGYAAQNPGDYETDPNWVDYFEVSTVDASGNRVFFGNSNETAVFYIQAVDGDGRITEIGTVDSGRGYISTATTGPPIVRLTKAPDGSALDPPIVVGVTVRAHGYLDYVELSNEGSGYIDTLSTTNGSIQIGNNTTLRIGGVSARLDTEFVDEDVGLNYTGALLGKEKYIGGVYAYEKITAAPHNAVRPFRLNVPSTGTPSVERGTYAFNQYAKWKDIVLDGTGENAYCIPYRESRVLRMNLNTGGDTLFGNFGGRWTSGAYSSLSGIIYGFPADSSSVLIIDPRNNAASEAVSYGNLEVEGTKFSSAVSVSNNAGYNGIVYAIPDRVDFSMEMNPGAPAKSVSLPPPWTTVNVSGTFKIVVAPSPDNQQITIHTVDPTSQPPAITGTSTLGVSPHPDQPTNFPWFGECVVVPSQSTVAFVPFYNQNSSAEYLGYVLLYNYTTNQYTWTKKQVPYRWAPPSPSRCAILGPGTSNSPQIWWTPKFGLETMVRFGLPAGVSLTQSNVSDGSEVLRFGNGADAFTTPGQENLQPESNRPVDAVSWATTGIGTDNTAVVTFQVDSRTYMTGYDIIARDDRQRNSRGCLAKNGKIYTFPLWQSSTLRSYDTNDEYARVETIVDLGEEGTGDLQGLTNVFNFYHSIYVPSTNEVYGIPNQAYDVFVYSIDNASLFKFGRKQLEDAPRRSGYVSMFPEFKSAVLLPDSRIVCVSSHLEQIVVIDPTVENYLERFLFLDVPPLGSDVLLGDVPYIDAIVVGEYAYFMPFQANKILRYHTTTDTVDFTGPLLDSNERAWGQPTYHPNGSIYVPQTNATTIVKVSVDPADGSVGETDVEFIPSNVEHPCKGASTGDDTMLYFSAERWRSILMMNPYSNECVYLEPIDPVTGKAWDIWRDPPYDPETFRVDYSLYQNAGDNSTSRTTREGEENSVNMIKAQDGRIFVVPETRRVYQVLYPAAKVIGNYTVATNEGTFEIAGYTTREFRNRPFVLEKEIDNKNRLFTLFHTDNGYGVYDAETKSIAFGPVFENGLACLFVTEDSTELISFGSTKTSSVRPFAGTVAGVKSSNETSDFYGLIDDGDYTFHLGNGNLTTRGVFGVIFARDANNVQTPGVFGSMTSVSGATGTITNYIRGTSLGRATYQFTGKPGKTFQIGQVEGVDSNGDLVFVSRFTGTLSEVITFQSDQVSRSRELFQDQNFAYNI